jgi:predicted transcriptional regulator
MLMSTPRTPKEIKNKNTRKTYSFSLNKENVESLSELAISNDLPISYLIDEAIDHYLKALKSDKKHEKNSIK